MWGVGVVPSMQGPLSDNLAVLSSCFFFLSLWGFVVELFFLSLNLYQKIPDSPGRFGTNALYLSGHLGHFPHELDP